MPRLRDLLKAIRVVGPWRFLRKLIQEISEDNILVWASSLAYSWLFAIFPFFIFLMTLVPYLPLDRDAIEKQIYNALSQSLPQRASQTILENLSTILRDRREGLLSTGIILAVWAASAGMSATMSALNQCYDVPENRPFWKQRGLAILLTTVVASLIVAVIILLPVSTMILNFISAPQRLEWILQWLDGRGLHVPREILIPVFWLWNFLRWSISLIFLMAVISIIHYFGPLVKQRFRIFTPGAVFTVLCWIAMGLVFRLYASGLARYDKTYGAIGGVVVLLFVFYLNSLVLLVGAEINSEITKILAKPDTAPRPAAS